MSKVKIQGNASGTGVVTLTAPNTNTDRTITLPDGTATLATKENFTSTGIDDNATSTAITIDASENVGIGVTPESWTVYRALQLGETGALGANSATMGIGQNWKFDGGNKYISTTTATRYLQSAGAHTFYVAPAGTADTAISWTTAMTIDNAGRMTIPNQPAFSVRRSSTSATSTHSIPDFDTVNHNIGSHYNTSTNRFTAPVSGVYSFSGHVIPVGLAQNSSFELWISLNSTSVRWFMDRQAKNEATAAGTFGVGGATSIYIPANDYVQLVTTSKSYADETNCWFSGQLIG